MIAALLRAYRWPLLIGAALLLLTIGACAYDRATQPPPRAIEEAHVSAAQTLGQQAARQAADLQATRDEVARLRAALEAAKRPRKPVPAPAPALDGRVDGPAVAHDAPGPLAPDLRDSLIAAQAQHIDGLEAQVLTLSASRDQWKAAAVSAGLRADAAPAHRPWAAGALVGIDSSGRRRFGAFASRQIGPATLHVAIVGDAAAVGAGWRW